MRHVAPARCACTSRWVHLTSSLLDRHCQRACLGEFSHDFRCRHAWRCPTCARCGNEPTFMKTALFCGGTEIYLASTLRASSQCERNRVCTFQMSLVGCDHVGRFPFCGCKNFVCTVQFVVRLIPHSSRANLVMRDQQLCFALLVNAGVPSSSFCGRLTHQGTFPPYGRIAIEATRRPKGSMCRGGGSSTVIPLCLGCMWHSRSASGEIH